MAKDIEDLHDALNAFNVVAQNLRLAGVNDLAITSALASVLKEQITHLDSNKQPQMREFFGIQVATPPRRTGGSDHEPRG